MDGWPIALQRCPRTSQLHRGRVVNSNGNSPLHIPRRVTRLQIQINAAARRRRARGAEFPRRERGTRGRVAPERGRRSSSGSGPSPPPLAGTASAMASSSGAGAAAVAAANLSAVRETMDGESRYPPFTWPPLPKQGPRARGRLHDFLPQTASLKMPFSSRILAASFRVGPCVPRYPGRIHPAPPTPLPLLPKAGTLPHPIQRAHCGRGARERTHSRERVSIRSLFCVLSGRSVNTRHQKWLGFDLERMTVVSRCGNSPGITHEAPGFLLEISRILNTGLDMETLSICVRLCEQGINPEALSSVIKELRKATEALKVRDLR
ncbi:PREDICTED: uncharacterized protein LOC102814976 [Chrysochloris asiatica]|uniref:Uncharacterized protein LOC102814976 n=1 Tax=Chrysochloris asiatica TaxID=185453 RepID=A0A9B0WPP5_CHRAS|nr:PREDICTED: uncharacterized protein LOC102814976 [Chrysochloris asiatica]